MNDVVLALLGNRDCENNSTQIRWARIRSVAPTAIGLTPNLAFEASIMSCASGLAVTLDEEMLLARGVDIAASTTLDSALLSKEGRVVAAELVGRYLLRYLLPEQIGAYQAGSTKLHYVTPAPISPRLQWQDLGSM